MVTLPPAGAVLGVDVGFSRTERSSAVCRLSWSDTSIKWNIKRFRAIQSERDAAISEIAGDMPLMAAAFDGPLQRGLDIIGAYRTAERILTRRLWRRIGKPGQSSAPIGVALNAAANDCAQSVLVHTRLGPATHAVAIHERAIAEAFPSSFLGLMIADPRSIAVRRKNRSDLFYEHLEQAGTLARLTAHLLPGRTATPFATVTNHDDRAALICALTALCVAADDYTAVGDAQGWIILPPAAFIATDAMADLVANAQNEPRGDVLKIVS
jgi:hypothetical protein